MSKTEENSPGSGHRARLRERFLRVGLEGFDDYEALELLLTFAIARKDVKPLAKNLLTVFGSYKGVLDAPQEKLAAVPGIGPAAATILQIIRANCCRYLLSSAKDSDISADPGPLIDYLRMKIGSWRKETMAVLYFNSRRRLLNIEFQAGTLDRAALYPREVVASALRLGAAGVVLAHNHPSGDDTPSEHDIAVTAAIKEALHTVGVSLYGHYIVTPDTYSVLNDEK